MPILLSLPYKAAGYLKVGEELLGSLDEVPHEPASDRDLVDAWSERLSLTGWYRWIPYDAPQEYGTFIAGEAGYKTSHGRSESAQIYFGHRRFRRVAFAG